MKNQAMSPKKVITILNVYWEELELSMDDIYTTTFHCCCNYTVMENNLLTNLAKLIWRFENVVLLCYKEFELSGEFLLDRLFHQRLIIVFTTIYTHSGALRMDCKMQGYINKTATTFKCIWHKTCFINQVYHFWFWKNAEKIIKKMSLQVLWR